MDQQRLQRFLERAIGDLGAAFSLAPVRIGGALGLYRALHEQGPLDAAGLARATGLAERYVREWLCHQAASYYVDYDPASECFELPEEHAMALAVPDSPCYVLPAFDAAVALLDNQEKVQEAFCTGGGVHWGEQSGCIACAIAEFFRPGYQANLVDVWLPALEGVVEKLERGARVVDVGCGHGLSTAMMARAFPNTEFVGIDFHQPSIDEARLHAERHGSPTNLSFEVARAQDFEGEGIDLVTCFDCLHDMGDPVSAVRRIREALAPDGTLMLVEPFAHDALEDNLNPVARMSYAASTMTCVPGSLAQEVGLALGAQAGQARLREVVVDAGGFASLDRVAETPFNMVLEARPGGAGLVLAGVYVERPDGTLRFRRIGAPMQSPLRTTGRRSRGLRRLTRGGLDAHIPLHRQPDHGHPQAERGRGQGARSVPRARHERGDVLQVALEVRRHGHVLDEAHEGARGGEPPAQEDVRRGEARGGDAPVRNGGVTRGHVPKRRRAHR